MTGLSKAGLALALAASIKRTKTIHDDPWKPRRKAADKERVFRGRCPVCRRMVARARIGKVALEKLVRHGKQKGRPVCKGSGLEPIRGGAR